MLPLADSSAARTVETRIRKARSMGRVVALDTRIVNGHSTDEAIAEHEHALEKQKETLGEVPVELLPFVRE